MRFLSSLGKVSSSAIFFVGGLFHPSCVKNAERRGQGVSAFWSVLASCAGFGSMSNGGVALLKIWNEAMLVCDLVGRATHFSSQALQAILTNVCLCWYSKNYTQNQNLSVWNMTRALHCILLGSPYFPIPHMPKISERSNERCWFCKWSITTLTTLGNHFIHGKYSIT
jgi:hypothetical protein